jgi:hypothetical protein
VALAGNADRAWAHIAAARDAGADSVNVFPLGDRRMETVRAFAACVADLTSGQETRHETRDREARNVATSDRKPETP